MATYILLMTLTPEGRARMAEDPESLLRAEESVGIPGTQVLGLYGVLGEYDFVSILEASDNEAAARFSLNLGVLAGAHIATLPAIPVTRLDPDTPPPWVSAEVPLPVGVADLAGAEDPEPAGQAPV